MSDLRARIDALPPEKRALFDQRLQERGLAENAFPISVMQQGIWFLEQLKPNNLAYVIPVAVQISGQLDTAVLLDAMNEVVRRHEALRTTFQLRDGKPMQIVRAALRLDLPELDLRDDALIDGSPAGGTVAGGRVGDGKLQSRIRQALDEPFDLTEGPLVRLKLLRIGVDECVLVVAMHHLISDGWSVGVLVAELSTLYEAFAAGRPSSLPELKIQYGDFAAWQQQSLKKDSLAADLEYWRTHLAGAPAVLTLTTDRPRPAVQGFNGSSFPFELPESLMRELGALGKNHGATTYMSLLAVFQILLHRYSTQDDVVVGVPTANRGRADIEPLIGFFVNTLPVRADLAGDPDFVEVLTRVRASCLGAYAHQEVPFETIVKHLKTPRDLSTPPIFQVSFSYQSDPLPSLAMSGVALRRLPLKSEGARFDLELQFFDDQGGLSGFLEYDRDLFDESTIARIAGHFRRLLELVVARPDLPVDQLPLLDDAERRRILVDGNATGRAWPGQGWIHQCFEQQVLATPRAEAVCFEHESLSYLDLNRRANQLAHRLIGLGVGRDVLVGVSMERSLEMVISLLAILKAGGAYLPLDPGYPQARLEYMLGDARVPVLLTQRRVLDGLPPVQAEVLCVDELAGALAAERGDNPEVVVGPEDLAYVIYTSGSTGKPKGVMNVHAAIRNRLLWMQDAYRLDGTDRVLQKTPFSFDVSVWEFFWPLMFGATLVVARPDAHKDSGQLVETIRARQITTLHFVPSMLQVFLAEPGVEQCVDLRRVICSGEALPRELQERFFARSPAQLHNLYGPTEAAVDVTSWACRRDGDPRQVPIGFPIANTQLYVLDPHLQPTPAGVPGELHIGGRNLARGYLNRPELTAEKFIPNPFDRSPEARLYKTGDLARYRDDGAIDYLGRLDHQVKLRGFRIELGEIEAVLTQHELVREAIVLAREYGPGDVRLVAYLTSVANPDAGELLPFLKSLLPEYMVPSAFVVLPAFPLLPNGKVDRGALPEPDQARPELQTRFVAPRDSMERAIAGVWCELLEVERVGTDDNFFDLGGHSLLIAELKARLAVALSREVSMVELFQYPTVGSLAAYLNQPAAAGSGPMQDAQERSQSRLRSRDQRQQAAARRALSRSGR